MTSVKGSVLVVGGGIGGIQASLDLANQGFYVYLVERELSIGGAMAQLDKTFPTNDCSMCILSPKLVEAQRHLNIEMLTYSQVKSIDGEAGNFTVKVLKQPRYVSLEKCKGCSDCAEACPVEFPNIYEEELKQRHAIYRPFEQAVPSAFGIDKRGEPPCKATCPIHVNAQGYIALTSKGKFEEALALVKEKNPFPGITGRVCHHPCESKCTRKDVDEPVAIDAIKRFLADYEIEHNKEFPIPEKMEPNGKKVAIVGSGPAGLLCAYDLALLGYKVKIFEALPVPGGMLAVGIPEYRLPRDVLKREIGLLEKLGVEIEVNTKVGKDITIDALISNYDALFVAIGAHISKRLRIEGEELDGLFGATEFLRKVNLNRKVNVGKNVTVIGGGNAAIDAARTALRLGAKNVTIVYRRSIKEMPANPEEIEDAIDEGIKIDFLSNPKRILGKNNKVTGLECYRMRLGELDESGRRRPMPIEGSEFRIETDMVIPAISQVPELDTLNKKEIIHKKWRAIDADPVTLQTSVKGIFAGGDAVTGPKTFIEAMAAGRKAAISIDRYLNGKDLKKGREKEGSYETEIEVDTKGIPYAARKHPLKIDLSKRRENFKEVNFGFDEERTIEEAKRCLNCGGCSECMECVKACEPEAIIHDMLQEEKSINVGALILAPGFDEYVPEEITEFGYKRYKNVVTSIEFERIMSASGPTNGHIVRHSDHKPPVKIAWIQCVGSRNKEYPFCSSVCCMYAVKEAVVAKEHDRTLKPTIFFMDIRAYGKDFDRYILRAENEYGVRYVRARPSSIKEDKNTNNLTISYEEDGTLKKEEFDMVVLSVGLHPPKSNKEFAEKTGIKLNAYGFAETRSDSPVETTEDGIFACGAFQGPKDIPETVTQASSAAGLVHSFLASARGTEVKEKEYPKEKFILNEKPRVGVFICHCGINIAGYLDVKKVTEYAKILPNVAYAEDNLYTCSADTQIRIKEKINEFNLNRVVVASCTPRTHEPLFQETIREAGLNKYLFSMANIRDQDSWVHQLDWDGATKKAKALISSAVWKASYLEPLSTDFIPITKSALVVGGGISGMNAALLLGKSGFETHLIEKNGELGGNALNIHRTIEGMDVQGYLKYMTKELEHHKLVHIHKKSEILASEGFVGNFKTKIKENGNEKEIEHGVVIIATGAKEYIPTEYLYGKDKRVLTQLELEKKIIDGDIDTEKPFQVVMIQCVGSRNDERPYCSRVCCSEAIKNAILLKENYSNAEVFVFYRDIRTYGFKEIFYEKARKLGVSFIRYKEESEPETSLKNGTIIVKTYEPVLQRDMLFEPDLLILSNGIVADADNNEKLSKFFKVPLNQDKFFLEAHVKLRPVDFATEGIYLCGLAHSPKSINESISQSYAAVSRALQVLTKETIETSGTVSHVNELNCVGCGMCELICPYKAINLVEKKVLGMIKKVAEVNPVICKGCGLCSANCRSNAIDLQGFTDQEVVVELTALGGINE